MDSLLPLAKKVGEKLKARKETIGVSESSAGGLVSAVLLSVPGASAYFMGGAVVYTRPAGDAKETQRKPGNIRRLVARPVEAAVGQPHPDVVVTRRGKDAVTGKFRQAVEHFERAMRGRELLAMQRAPDAPALGLSLLDLRELLRVTLIAGRLVQIDFFLPVGAGCMRGAHQESLRRIRAVSKGDAGQKRRLI